MPLLAPLPATRFGLSDWKVATVQFNYHIAVDKMYYSVPYQYIKNKVDVRITETTIEICAFGMEACKQYYTVKYVRLPDLLLELEAARNDGSFLKILSKYGFIVLLSLYT